ncbi:MAG: DUF4296 domain-containing protein [Bacteroidales bacterium]|jgi:hypothetical protein
MNNRTEKHVTLWVRIILIVLAVLIIAPGCRHGNKSGGKGLIPEKDFIAILKDSYLADGILSLPQMRDLYLVKDSVSNYIDIIKNHGYTYEEMNNTIRYYFMNKPKQMIKIYDMIQEKFTEIESQVIKKQEEAILTEAEKNKNTAHFLLPDPKGSVTPSLSFDVNGPGTFTLSFSVTLFADDLSYNTCFMAWYVSADSILTGHRTYLPPVRYIKDGTPHLYNVTGKINCIGPCKLQGSYYIFENNISDNEKFVEISNKAFSFRKNPKAL